MLLLLSQAGKHPSPQSSLQARCSVGHLQGQGSLGRVGAGGIPWVQSSAAVESVESACGHADDEGDDGNDDHGHDVVYDGDSEGPWQQ